MAMLIPNAAAASELKDIEIYKLYAYTKLLNAKQFHCLDLLWTHESHWNPTSKNKQSTAFGIPQILGMKETNPYRQIDLGLAYIGERYSIPCNAWLFSKNGNGTY